MRRTRPRETGTTESPVSRRSRPRAARQGPRRRRGAGREPVTGPPRPSPPSASRRSGAVGRWPARRRPPARSDTRRAGHLLSVSPAPRPSAGRRTYRFRTPAVPRVRAPRVRGVRRMEPHVSRLRPRASGTTGCRARETGVTTAQRPLSDVPGPDHAAAKAPTGPVAPRGPAPGTEAPAARVRVSARRDRPGEGAAVPCGRMRSK